MNYNIVFNDCIPFKTVVLANGNFPENAFVLSLLRAATTIIVCDGALKKLLSYGLSPTAVIGDGDSLPPHIQQQYFTCFYQDCDDEINDLCKAMNYCQNREYDHILIMGATGLREDHSIGNIAHLEDFALNFQVKMITDYGVFEWLRQSQTIKSCKGQQISIFSFNNQQIINSEGLKYPIVKRAFSALWQGTLNEALSDEFELQFNGSGLLVYRSFEIKKI